MADVHYWGVIFTFPDSFSMTFAPGLVVGDVVVPVSTIGGQIRLTWPAADGVGTACTPPGAFLAYVATRSGATALEATAFVRQLLANATAWRINADGKRHPDLIDDLEAPADGAVPTHETWLLHGPVFKSLPPGTAPAGGPIALATIGEEPFVRLWAQYDVPIPATKSYPDLGAMIADLETRGVSASPLDVLDWLGAAHIEGFHAGFPTGDLSAEGPWS